MLNLLDLNLDDTTLLVALLTTLIYAIRVTDLPSLADN